MSFYPMRSGYKGSNEKKKQLNHELIYRFLKRRSDDMKKRNVMYGCVLYILGLLYLLIYQ